MQSLSSGKALLPPADTPGPPSLIMACRQVVSMFADFKYVHGDGRGRVGQIYSGVSQNQSRAGVEWKGMSMLQRRNTRPANKLTRERKGRYNLSVWLKGLTTTDANNTGESTICRGRLMDIDETCSTGEGTMKLDLWLIQLGPDDTRKLGIVIGHGSGTAAAKVALINF